MASGMDVTTDKPVDEFTFLYDGFNKMLETLYPDFEVPDETREHCVNLGKEFLLKTIYEAEEIANQQKKKTITHDHILMAMEKLGMSKCHAHVKSYLKETKAMATEEKRNNKLLENLEIPEEERLKQQQAFFAKVQAALTEQQQEEEEEQ
nr:protein Dr1-like isoform X2 [Cherax quadricarinatus]